MRKIFAVVAGTTLLLAATVGQVSAHGHGSHSSHGGSWGGSRGFISNRGPARSLAPSVSMATRYRAVSAYPGRRVGVYPRHFGHRRFFGRPFYPGYIYGGSCWRLRLTPFGWQRVWVCGYPYGYGPYGYYPYW